MAFVADLIVTVLPAVAVPLTVVVNGVSAFRGTLILTVGCAVATATVAEHGLFTACADITASVRTPGCRNTKTD
jgi:hypothetical protein